MWKIALGAILGLVLVAGPVFAAPEFKPVHVFQDAAGATDDGTALQVQGWGTIGVQVVITATATVIFEGTVDGSNWISAVCSSIASTSGALVTTASSSGLYQCSVAGFSQFRVRVSSWSSGTVTVKGLTTLITKRGSGGGGGAAASAVQSSDTLPPDCTVGDVYVDTDATSGSKFHYCDTTNTWVDVVTAETQTLDQAFDQGKTIDGANSVANAVRIGDGVTPVCIYTDASLGPQVRPCTDANTQTVIPTNFTWCLYNIEATSCILTVDPDAASVNAMYQFATAYKPVASLIVALSPRGAATMTETNIVTDQPKSWWGTLTDANTDAFDFSFPVTTKMVGATTATIRLIGVSDNASPSGNIDLDCAMSAYTPGTDTFAAHVTTNEVTVLLTPATQNRPVATTSAAHTINGTLVAGDLVTGSCEVDASATTSAQLTDFFLWGFATIQLSVNSLSD